MNEQTELQAHIEELYAVFARYPLHHPVAGCPCCVSRADQERIAAKPLRQLNSFDLERYIWKAMSTWGDVDDFRHFLPRIMELLGDPQERSNLFLFVIFGKLPYGHWETWQEQEQQAVNAYLLALWRWILMHEPGDGDYVIHEYLEALIDAKINCTPYLNVWCKWHTPLLLCQLSRFIRYYPWNDGLPKHSPIKAWLRESATKEALEAGFYKYMDEPWAEELAYAVETLEWLTQK